MMTVAEVKSSLAALGISEDVWLHETAPWEKIGTICMQSTYHIYLDRYYDYMFNSVTETLDIAILDPDRTIKRSIDYTNIVCFNGTYYINGGVQHIKSFR